MRQPSQNQLVSQALQNLLEEVQEAPWFVSIGVGGTDMDIIYLYVTNDRHPALNKYKSGFQSCQVIISKTGKITV
jgi:hypothetical protein